MKTIGRVDVPQEAFKLEKECRKSCPVVKTGKLCIEVTPTSNTAFLSEELCIGCVKFSDVKSQKSPFQAIQIINLPKDLEKDTIHCYNSNGFKLHRVPVPRPGKVLGLVGTNCILKSTALQILAGKIKPNLGRYNCYEATICGCYEKIPKGTLGMVLEKLDERGMMSEICDAMDLNHLLDREATQVSGGELQRFSIAAVSDKPQESEGKVKSYAR
ncbi:hypothetical protein YC2023_082064 [Brassica napus]